MSPDEQPIGSKGWISYRPELKVLDCTIRDGGLMNNHHFTDQVVEAVYRACCEGGIDYMEIGYKGARGMYAEGENGKWRFCAEDDVKRVVEAAGELPGRTKLSVMADVDRTDHRNDLPRRDHSVVSMVRVATYIHQIPAAIELVDAVADKGYETCVNIMALSTAPRAELEGALALLARSRAGAIYVVDSFGSLYGEQVREYVDLYLSHARPAGKEVGIHTHNNQQLAFANTIEAIVRGANLVDGSLAGLGRGAGNCPTELLAGFLHNPRYRLRPLIACVQNHIEPLRQGMRWGFDIPYMLCGLLNQHPRSAMEFNESERHHGWLAFYDAISAKE
jgi:4-hydroxy 2-oxovalerate aldolase